MSFLPQEYQGSGLDGLVLSTKEYAGEITLEVDPRRILDVMKILRDAFGYDYLADITGTDFFTEDKRFGISYNLCNLSGKKRLRVSARLSDSEEPHIHSIIKIYPAAAWFEREVWDMLGIRFEGHPDHRRIFMPEDFEYFPLRKEFPLIGIPGTIQLPDKTPPKEYK